MPRPAAPTLSISPALPADLPAVWAIEREQFSNPWTMAYFQAELGNRLSHFYVAREPGRTELAGFLIFWRLDDEIELHKIAVAGEKRRRGYGRQLLDFIIGCARSWNCRAIALEVRAGNAAAVGLYEQAGFRRAGLRRDYYSMPAEDALLFRLDLDRDAGPVRRNPARG
jgi:ribosomal-protein-alanine N-acetyltransferase